MEWNVYAPQRGGVRSPTWLVVIGQRVPPHAGHISDLFQFLSFTIYFASVSDKIRSFSSNRQCWRWCGCSMRISGSAHARRRLRPAATRRPQRRRRTSNRISRPVWIQPEVVAPSPSYNHCTSDGLQIACDRHLFEILLRPFSLLSLFVSVCVFVYSVQFYWTNAAMIKWSGLVIIPEDPKKCKVMCGSLEGYRIEI